MSHSDIATVPSSERTTMLPTPESPKNDLAEADLRPKRTTESFNELIANRAIAPHFQKIVSIEDGDLFGFELLARSTIKELACPSRMFPAAEYLNRAAELSELCRSVGFETAVNLPEDAILFVNTHPSESLLTGILPSIRRLRMHESTRRVVVEIHEDAVTDSETLNEFSFALSDLNVDLAFDDFGVGRARLLQLIHVPPRYVKFDARMIRGVDHSPGHQEIVLKSMIEMLDKIGCKCVAEGVETEKDLELCKRMGFQYAQGFYLARPTSIENILAAQVETNQT